MILYLLDTIRKVRKNSKENLPIDIGTSRIKVTVVTVTTVTVVTVSFPFMEDHHKFSDGQGL